MEHKRKWGDFSQLAMRIREGTWHASVQWTSLLRESYFAGGLKCLARCCLRQLSLTTEEIGQQSISTNPILRGVSDDFEAHLARLPKLTAPDPPIPMRCGYTGPGTSPAETSAPHRPVRGRQQENVSPGSNSDAPRCHGTRSAYRCLVTWPSPTNAAPPPTASFPGIGVIDTFKKK